MNKDIEQLFNQSCILDTTTTSFLYAQCKMMKKLTAKGTYKDKPTRAAMYLTGQVMLLAKQKGVALNLQRWGMDRLISCAELIKKMPEKFWPKAVRAGLTFTAVHYLSKVKSAKYLKAFLDGKMQACDIKAKLTPRGTTGRTRPQGSFNEVRPDDGTIIFKRADPPDVVEDKMRAFFCGYIVAHSLEEAQQVWTNVGYVLKD